MNLYLFLFYFLDVLLVYSFAYIINKVFVSKFV